MDYLYIGLAVLAYLVIASVIRSGKQYRESPVLIGLFGPMGSGKTYETMKYHLIPTLKSGQPVATNIKGIDEPENLQAISTYTGIPLDTLYQQITRLPFIAKDLFAEDIWPRVDPQTNKFDSNHRSLIKPGTATFLDECATVFNKAPPDHVLRYLTEQRHGISDSGHHGKTVVISQSPAIHFSVRNIMSVAYVFSTFGMLGPILRFLRPLGIKMDYRAEVYTDMSKSIGKAKPNNMVTRAYDKDIFKLYGSHDKKQSELTSSTTNDSRSTVLGSKYMMLLPFAVIALMYYGATYLYDKFGGFIKDKNPAAVVSSSPAPAPATGLTPAPVSTTQASTNLRLVGNYSDGVANYYITSDSENNYTYYRDYELKEIVNYGPVSYIVTKDNVTIKSIRGKQHETKNKSGNPSTMGL